MELNASCVAGKLVALAIAGACTCALAAPGEDPVQITSRVSYLQMPTAPRAGSTDIRHRSGMPEDVRAKMAHYTAKAYSSDTTGISTEKDVVSSVKTDGMGATTCVQTVQPATAGSERARSGDQVVVIRGDLINICR